MPGSGKKVKLNIAALRDGKIVSMGDREFLLGEHIT